MTDIIDPGPPPTASPAERLAHARQTLRDWTPRRGEPEPLGAAAIREGARSTIATILREHPDLRRE